MILKGCYIQLEKKASEVILDNIKSSLGLRAGLISRIESFTEDTGLELNLENFLNYYHLSARNIYAKYSFERLCADAGVRPEFDEAGEELITKVFSKILAIDSRRWIDFLVAELPQLTADRVKDMTGAERRMFQMFYISVWNKSADDLESPEVRKNLTMLKNSPVMLQEILTLLRYNKEHIDFIDSEVSLGFDCPLDLYCTYTRD